MSDTVSKEQKIAAKLQALTMAFNQFVAGLAPETLQAVTETTLVASFAFKLQAELLQEIEELQAEVERLKATTVRTS